MATNKDKGATELKNGPKKKASKHKNINTDIDGITFASKAEGRRYQELKLLARSGVITDLEMQVPFVITDSCVIGGRKRPGRKYIADFVYKRDGEYVIEDVKGRKEADPIFSIKRHLMKSVLGLDIVEIRY